jgi:hypothetical protein
MKVKMNSIGRMAIALAATAALAMGARPASADVVGGFGVDYGSGGQSVQSGYVGGNAPANAPYANSVVANVVAPFNVGGDVTVTLSMATLSLRGLNRNNLTGSTGLNDLVDDIIINEGGGDMTLTLAGLPAGTFQFVGYFNDSFYNAQSGSIGLSGWGINLYIGANDGTPDATAVGSDYRDANPSDPIETATLMLVSNGTDPVVVTLQGTTNLSNPFRLPFNGFTLDGVATGIPEPASLGLLAIAVTAWRRRR